MRQKVFTLLVGLILASMLLTGCGVNKPNRPIVIIASDQPGPADPAENWTFGGAAYLPLVYESLYRFKGEKSPSLELGLAADFPKVSADGLVYTISLKPNLTFHDGSMLNADAVLYSYERIKALNKGANGITADWIASMQKVNDTAVSFTLKAPFADFPTTLGSVWGNYIVNPKVCK